MILLRAVNVGSATLRMTTFTDALLSAGFRDVSTLGAAGSAVALAPEGTDPARLETTVERELASRVGWDTVAFVRSPSEWQQMLAGNPFRQEAASEPALVHVSTLKSKPPADAWAALRRSIQGRERVAPGIGCAYLHYPDGAGRSKLTAAVIERALGTRATSRNWNTAVRLGRLLTP